MLCSAQRLATIVLGLALLAPGSWAQSSAAGTINVTVLDPTGASIPGATLEIKDLGTNDLRRAMTQQTGAYTFPNLPFGTYQLTITASGFQQQVFASVQVQTARVTDIRATLQVGGTVTWVDQSSYMPHTISFESPFRGPQDPNAFLPAGVRSGSGYSGGVAHSGTVGPPPEFPSNSRYLLAVLGSLKNCGSRNE